MQNDHFNIIPIIKELESNLLLDPEIIGEVLEVDPRILDQPKLMGTLSFRQISNLSSFLGLPIEKLVNQEIDYQAIKDKFYSSVEKVPDKYSIGAGSYISGIRSMHNYIKNCYGKATAIEALKNFDLTENSIINDKNMNNLFLVNDVIDYCIESLGFEKSDVKQMALRSYIDGQRKEILKMASTCKTVKELLQLMVNHSEKYEVNFHYYLIDIGNSKYILRSESKEEITDTLKTQKVSTLENNFYKSYVIELSPVLAGLGNIKITGVQSTVISGKQIIHYYIKESFNNRAIIH